MAKINVSRTELFLVTLQFSMDKYRVCTPESLPDVLKENRIESIKRLNPSKARFERVSRKLIRELCSYCTATDVYLSTHYYFAL